MGRNIIEGATKGFDLVGTDLSDEVNQRSPAISSVGDLVESIDHQRRYKFVARAQRCVLKSSVIPDLDYQILVGQSA